MDFTERYGLDKVNYLYIYIYIKKVGDLEQIPEEHHIFFSDTRVKAIYRKLLLSTRKIRSKPVI